MASQQANDPREGALEDLAHGLGQQAREFTPSQPGLSAESGELPGRRPGESLADQSVTASVAATVVIDCGTSRRSGYSHVLWISPSSESMLGSHGLDRLTEAIVHMPGITAYEWEGLDLLHLRAAGSDWEHLLAGARAAVDALLDAL